MSSSCMSMALCSNLISMSVISSSRRAAWIAKPSVSWADSLRWPALQRELLAHVCPWIEFCLAHASCSYLVVSGHGSETLPDSRASAQEQSSLSKQPTSQHVRRLATPPAPGSHVLAILPELSSTHMPHTHCSGTAPAKSCSVVQAEHMPPSVAASKSQISRRVRMEAWGRKRTPPMSTSLCATARGSPAALADITTYSHASGCSSLQLLKALALRGACCSAALKLGHKLGKRPSADAGSSAAQPVEPSTSKKTLSTALRRASRSCSTAEPPSCALPYTECMAHSKQL
mmetsp:Transcript_102326/g.257778  ORF Transcript_102326/g.257778 Transcript_102326/m.257778 type:complete len:288 (+) Transcript_102326:4570-5433(+)